MKSSLVNRLIRGLEWQVTQSAKQRIRDAFQSYPYSHSSRNDSVEIRKLTQKYNEKVIEYNRLGEKLAALFILKMDQFRPQPQDDFRGVVDEWLRLRSLNRSPILFTSVNSEMHRLEKQLNNLVKGEDGLEILKTQIKLKRRLSK